VGCEGCAADVRLGSREVSESPCEKFSVEGGGGGGCCCGCGVVVAALVSVALTFSEAVMPTTLELSTG